MNRGPETESHGETLQRKTDSSKGSALGSSSPPWRGEEGHTAARGNQGGGKPRGNPVQLALLVLCIRFILITGNVFRTPIWWTDSSGLLMLRMPDVAVATSSSTAMGDSGHITDHWLLHGHTAQVGWRPNGLRMGNCWMDFAKPAQMGGGVSGQARALCRPQPYGQKGLFSLSSVVN